MRIRLASAKHRNGFTSVTIYRARNKETVTSNTISSSEQENIIGERVTSNQPRRYLSVHKAILAYQTVLNHSFLNNIEKLQRFD